MLCRNPFVQGMQPYPCGQCMPCRLNRRRVWTHRIMLEANLKSDNVFVGLTYAEENLPAGGLNPIHTQLWLKRLRKAVRPLSIRYYLVGEYGDESWRPHYHVALFGYPSCLCHVYNNGKPTRFWRSCSVCDVLRDTWGYGIIHSGELNVKSAQYLAGYVTKKMTRFDDPRLKGLYPEFARMSLKPGIGGDFSWEMASTFMQFNLEAVQGDVPVTLQHGKKQLPLGRYMRKRWREQIGWDAKAPQEVRDAQFAEMCSLYESKVRNGSFVSIKDALVDQGTQAVTNIAGKQRIFKGRKSL